jgi:hypothetical protein
VIGAYSDGEGHGYRLLRHNPSHQRFGSDKLRFVTHCENQSKNAQNAWKIQEVMRDSLGFSHLPAGLTRLDFHT